MWGVGKIVLTVIGSLVLILLIFSAGSWIISFGEAPRTVASNQGSSATSWMSNSANSDYSDSPDSSDYSDSPATPAKTNVVQEKSLTSLSDIDFVQALPDSAVIEFKTDTKTYTIGSGSVELGTPSNPDMTLTLPSRYINELLEDFCSTLEIANKKRDLGLTWHISTFKAGLKYSGMLKYKSCLGL